MKCFSLLVFCLQVYLHLSIPCPDSFFPKPSFYFSCHVLFLFNFFYPIILSPYQPTFPLSLSFSFSSLPFFYSLSPLTLPFSIPSLPSLLLLSALHISPSFLPALTHLSSSCCTHFPLPLSPLISFLSLLHLLPSSSPPSFPPSLSLHSLP